MEVKHQDEEEENDAGGCSKGGKLSNHKTEEKPVKSELKKEDCSGEGGKGILMDTSTPTETSGVKTEDRKVEVKKEVKDEEETSETATPQVAVKKKSKKNFLQLIFFCSQTLFWLLAKGVFIAVRLYLFRFGFLTHPSNLHLIHSL